MTKEKTFKKVINLLSKNNIKDLYPDVTRPVLDGDTDNYKYCLRYSNSFKCFAFSKTLSELIENTHYYINTLL